MEKIYKCKLIGDGKAKPFWATLTEVNGAIKICREFMDQYVFSASNQLYREIFDLIDKGFGIRAYQWRCGIEGKVVTRVYDKSKPKRWQRGKLRVYNVYMDKYLEEGYYQIPHLKTEECQIKDKSGIHCKNRVEIARIFMDKIVSKYFANTFNYAMLNDKFTATMTINAGESAHISGPKNVLMVLFEADLIYKSHLSSLEKVNELVYDKYFRPLVDKFSAFGLIMGQYCNSVFTSRMLAESTYLGKYGYSGITTDGYSYTLRFAGSGEDAGIDIGQSDHLHIFDVISEFTKQIKKEGKRAESFHMSIHLDENFWPSEYANYLERIESA